MPGPRSPTVAASAEVLERTNGRRAATVCPVNPNAARPNHFVDRVHELSTPERQRSPCLSHSCANRITRVISFVSTIVFHCRSVLNQHLRRSHRLTNGIRLGRDGCRHSSRFTAQFTVCETVSTIVDRLLSLPERSLLPLHSQSLRPHMMFFPEFSRKNEENPCSREWPPLLFLHLNMVRGISPGYKEESTIALFSSHLFHQIRIKSG